MEEKYWNFPSQLHTGFLKESKITNLDSKEYVET